MAGNSAFQMVAERGWRGGLRNLLRIENGKWWRSRTWWVQTLLWTVIINGILAGILWSGQPVSAIDAVSLYCIFSGLFPAIAVIIIMQDELVGEKETGTAAWILSKPVSRTAFVLAKFVANSLGVLVTMLLIPGIVAYIQISLALGSWLAPLNFLGGIGVLYVNQLYYLSLTLMLGAFFHRRGPVIGIPLALAFGQQMIFGMLPIMAQVLPWTLVVPLGELEVSIASGLILGQTPPSLYPLYISLVCVVVFTGLAFWRFEKEEF
jgi:ABC-2 type transport system permease protein